MKGKSSSAVFSATATAIVLALVLMSVPGCSKQSSTLKIVPVQYIPPEYYDCAETTPNDLLNAYYSHYNAIGSAETIFNGKIFVFKNITVTASSLKYATDEYIWVESSIKCYFLVPGGAQKLKADEKVDVVGIDAGICKDYSGSLTFTGCIFLPAGEVQLPAGEGSGVTVPVY